MLRFGKELLSVLVFCVDLVFFFATSHLLELCDFVCRNKDSFNAYPDIKTKLLI